MDTGGWYRYFAEVEAKATSPSYRRLANGVADDCGLITLLELLPAPKRQPNLLFAAVRYLDGPSSDWESFRSFVETHWAAVRNLMSVRSTQTNEVARCGTILLALAELQGPIALIEVGASAGLCLLPDRYGYSFNEQRIGNSPLRIEVDCSGPLPIPATLPEISWRCGIDLNPLDVTNPDDVAWLRSCIWPEHTERRERFDLAVAIAAENAPTIVRGDLIDRIGSVLDEAPADSKRVVFHSAVMSYLDAGRRRAFAAMMHARDDVVWISNESPGVVPDLVAPDPPPTASAFLLARDGQALAFTDPHGSWIAWLPQR